jgi:hypothetical protein
MDAAPDAWLLIDSSVVADGNGIDVYFVRDIP